jgi:hypothetical protein
VRGAPNVNPEVAVSPLILIRVFSGVDVAVAVNRQPRSMALFEHMILREAMYA